MSWQMDAFVVVAVLRLHRQRRKEHRCLSGHVDVAGKDSVFHLQEEETLWGVESLTNSFTKRQVPA